MKSSSQENPLVVGVFGSPGSGKTWLLRNLINSLPKDSVLSCPAESYSEIEPLQLEYAPTAVDEYLIRIKLPHYIWNNESALNYKEYYLKVVEVGGLATLGYKLEESIRVATIERLEKQRQESNQLQAIAAVIRTQQNALSKARQRSESLMKSVIGKRVLSQADALIHAVDLSDLSTVLDTMALHNAILSELSRIGRSQKPPNVLIAGLKKDLRKNFLHLPTSIEPHGDEVSQECISRPLLLRLCNLFAQNGEQHSANTYSQRARFGIYETSSTTLPWAGLMTIASALRLSGTGFSSIVASPKVALFQHALCCYTPHEGGIKIRLDKALNGEGEELESENLSISVEPIKVLERSPLSHVLKSEVHGIVTLLICPQTLQALQFQHLEKAQEELPVEDRESHGSVVVSNISDQIPKKGRFPWTQSRALQKLPSYLQFSDSTNVPVFWQCTSHISLKHSSKEISKQSAGGDVLDTTEEKEISYIEGEFGRIVLPLPEFAKVILKPKEERIPLPTNQFNKGALTRIQSASSTRLSQGKSLRLGKDQPKSGIKEVDRYRNSSNSVQFDEWGAKVDQQSSVSVTPQIPEKLRKALGLSNSTYEQQRASESAKMHSISALSMTPLKLRSDLDLLVDSNFETPLGIHLETLLDEEAKSFDLEDEEVETDVAEASMYDNSIESVQVFESHDLDKELDTIVLSMSDNKYIHDEALDVPSLITDDFV